MKLPVFFVALAAVVVAALVLGRASGVENAHEAGPQRSGTRVGLTENTIGGLQLKAETKRSVGAFKLRKGRKVELITASTEDRRPCLIDEDETGMIGGTCLEGSLFGSRKVVFSVSSQGGPERFSELYLAGVASPEIRSVWLGKTGGSSIEGQLTRERAFLFESSAAELDAGIYPTELRLYGQNGRLVETVRFPPAG